MSYHIIQNRYIAKYGYTISDSKIEFRKILKSLETWNRLVKNKSFHNNPTP